MPSPIYTTTVVRPWCQLDAAASRGGLLSSLLCQPDTWSNYDVDGLTYLYDSEIGVILDRLVPWRTVACRRGPSDLWFDDMCRPHRRRRYHRHPQATYISPLLCELHLLRVPERIKFRLVVLVIHCRNQTTPVYLSRELQWAVYDEPQRRLRSASSQRLIVRRTQLRTAGDRAFGAAAPRLWNSSTSRRCHFIVPGNYQGTVRNIFI